MRLPQIHRGRKRQEAATGNRSIWHRKQGEGRGGGGKKKRIEEKENREEEWRKGGGGGMGGGTRYGMGRWWGACGEGKGVWKVDGG